MIKICILTANRAEYGILKNIIVKLIKNKDFKVEVLVTGSHLDKKFGLTKKEITNDSIKINKIINIFPKNDKVTEILKFMSRSILEFSKIISPKKYNYLLILGDRYDLIAPALVAFFNNIPIIHINGGDITKGSLDDNIRNIITSISSIHFVTNKYSKKRVENILGNKKNIFNVGSLSYSRIKNTKSISKKTLEKKHNIKFNKFNCLVTFHPITNNKNQTQIQIRALLSALMELKETMILFTYPNNDEGSEIIINYINQFIKIYKNSHFIKSLGFDNYINICKHSDFVIGNSSSFVLEVPMLNKPSILIGNRQIGRILSNYNYKTNSNKKNILQIINKIIYKKDTYKSEKNIYVKSNTENKIIKLIKKYNSKY